VNTHSLFTRLCHSPIPRRAAVLLVVLAWSSLAFGGEIHDAARNGDLEKVKALLKDNPDLVFSKDGFGWTPLHWAADTGHKDVAELLLANKADATAKNNLGDTPLHWAAWRGQKAVAELLLTNKADANAKNNFGDTPMHWAGWQGQKAVAELLLTNKADVNAKTTNGWTPLHLALAAGRKDVVELLLANKADVNANPVQGVRLSIAMTNRVFEVPSSTAVTALTTNASSNAVMMDITLPPMNYRLLLTNRAGKCYDVPAPFAGNGFSETVTLQPGETHMETIRIFFFGSIEPGDYTLMATRTVIFPWTQHSDFTFEDQSFKLVSDPLKITILK
jgi:ankyrin repeat protein